MKLDECIAEIIFYADKDILKKIERRLISKYNKSQIQFISKINLSKDKSTNLKQIEKDTLFV